MPCLSGFEISANEDIQNYIFSPLHSHTNLATYAHLSNSVSWFVVPPFSPNNQRQQQQRKQPKPEITEIKDDTNIDYSLAQFTINGLFNYDNNNNNSNTCPKVILDFDEDRHSRDTQLAVFKHFEQQIIGDNHPRFISQQTSCFSSTSHLQHILSLSSNQTEDYDNSSSLLFNLPSETILLCLMFCDIPSILSFEQTSRQAFQLVNYNFDDPNNGFWANYALSILNNDIVEIEKREFLCFARCIVQTQNIRDALFATGIMDLPRLIWFFRYFLYGPRIGNLPNSREEWIFSFRQLGHRGLRKDFLCHNNCKKHEEEDCRLSMLYSELNEIRCNQWMDMKQYLLAPLTKDIHLALNNYISDDSIRNMIGNVIQMEPVRNYAKFMRDNVSHWRQFLDKAQQVENDHYFDKIMTAFINDAMRILQEMKPIDTTISNRLKIFPECSRKTLMFVHLMYLDPQVIDELRDEGFDVPDIDFNFLTKCDYFDLPPPEIDIFVSTKSHFIQSEGYLAKLIQSKLGSVSAQIQKRSSFARHACEFAQEMITLGEDPELKNMIEMDYEQFGEYFDAYYRWIQSLVSNGHTGRDYAFIIDNTSSSTIDESNPNGENHPYFYNYHEHHVEKCSSQIIDILYHFHILHSKQFRTFCKQLGGVFSHRFNQS